MAHAENKITINRPVNEVFAFVLDGDNNSKWRPGVLDIQRL
ncbi:MAG TPA: SRPBCC family protein, partial [Anaerolineae bacterium]